MTLTVSLFLGLVEVVDLEGCFDLIALCFQGGLEKEFWLQSCGFAANISDTVAEKNFVNYRGDIFGMDKMF